MATDVHPAILDLLDRARAKANAPRAKLCPVCGSTFEGTGHAIYCGRNCLVRAYRARKHSRRTT